ncbi:MAG: hypothetical protein DA439_05465 [Bacteroidetes bacterium]|nr:MAG: hypothetical protein DA439_05465 [Bacteroidota bacterium]
MAIESTTTFKRSTFFKTHGVALLFFLLLSCVFYYPALQGKVLEQTDIIQYNGMAHLRNELRAAGEESYYTQNAFGGMPTYQLGAQYAYQGVKTIDRLIRFLPRPIDYLFLYLISFYILLSSLKIDFKLSILGSLAFSLATYHLIIIEVGHNSKAHAIGYFPLVLASLLYLFRSRKIILPTLFLTLSMALELAANHYQMTYYLFMLIGMYLLFRAYLAITVKEGVLFLKRLGVFIVSVSWAVLLNASTIFATRQYAQFSTRSTPEISIEGASTNSGLSFDYITAYSYGIAESFNLFIPRLFGGSNSERLPKGSHLELLLKKYNLSPTEIENFTNSSPLYFGSQPIVAAPAYLGASVLLLFVLGLITLSFKDYKWLYFSMLLALFLSFGKNLSFLSHLFVDYFPLYNKFRAVSSIQVILSFTVPIIAVLGLRKWLSSPSTQSLMKALIISLIVISLGILLPFTLGFSGANDISYESAYGPEFMDALRSDRTALALKDSLRSFLIILVVCTVLYIYSKRLKEVLLYLVVGAVLLDLGGVAYRYTSVDHFQSKREFQNPIPLTDADKEIQSDNGYYRVFNLNEGLNGATTAYHHRSIGGYHAAKPAFISQIFEYHIANENYEVLDLLNIKYLISNDEEGRIASSYPNSKGPVWIARSIDYQPSLKESFLNLPLISQSESIEINEPFSFDYEENRALSKHEFVEVSSFKESQISYRYRLESPAFVIFSEWYYSPSPEDWVLRRDNGESLKIYRTNYAFMGAMLSEGEGEITLSFEPKIISQTLWIRIIAQIGLLALFLVAIVVYRGKAE